MPDQFHVHLYGPDRGPIQTSFEAAAGRLESLEKLYFEPDGSFVWNRDAGRQQIFGMLYDAGGQIQYADLRGTCSIEMWSGIVAAIAGIGRKCTVVSLADGAMKDLQSFEGMTWIIDTDNREK